MRHRNVWTAMAACAVFLAGVACQKPAQEGQNPAGPAQKAEEKGGKPDEKGEKPGEKGGKPSAGMSREPAPVRVGEVVQKAMPVLLNTIGTVEALSTVQVKAQVSGELMKVCFAEGDFVEKDQVLFQIDPQPYEIALRQAEASVARAQAQAEQSRATVAKDRAQASNARVVAERDANLLTRKMVSQEDYDQTRTNAEALEAAVVADEATVKSSVEAIRAAEVTVEDAKLRLDYCTIRAPIAGKTGSLLTYQGNLVKASDTMAMVTITQISPIYVTFTLPEKHLSQVRQYMEKGSLEVKAVLPMEEDKPVAGKLSFIDNLVEEATGTIRMKATFENADKQLWPGQFLNVSLQVTVLADAIVAPTSAVQAGQSGPYAYVVKSDMTVEMRNVTLGDEYGAEIIVKEGLRPGEKIITDGQVRVAPGAAVKILDDAALEGQKSS